MRRSYVETFFRHRILLTVPLLLAFVLGTAYGFQQPREYISVATVFTDAPIPNDSTLTSGGGSTPPATNQVQVLTELLNSRSFLADVANHAPHAPKATSAAPAQVDQDLAAIARSVKVATLGPQLLGITVKSNSAEDAPKIARAVVERYIATITGRLSQRAKEQVAYDSKQVNAAGQTLSDAEVRLREYTADHKSADGTLTSDAGASNLAGAVALAQQTYSVAQTALAKDTAAMAHVADSAVINVLDAPSRAIPQSNKKSIIFGAAGGLLGGLALSLLAIVVLMAMDKSVRRETDIEEGLPLQVVGTIGDYVGKSRLRRRRSS